MHFTHFCKKGEFLPLNSNMHKIFLKDPIELKLGHKLAGLSHYKILKYQAICSTGIEMRGRNANSSARGPLCRKLECLYLETGFQKPVLHKSCQK